MYKILKFIYDKEKKMLRVKIGQYNGQLTRRANSLS